MEELNTPYMSTWGSKEIKIAKDSSTVSIYPDDFFSLYSKNDS